MQVLFSGADDEARTRYLHLGKVALYQMSYIRNCKAYYNRADPVCQENFSPKKFLFFPISYLFI